MSHWLGERSIQGKFFDNVFNPCAGGCAIGGAISPAVLQLPVCCGVAR